MNPFPFQLVTRLGRWRPVCVNHRLIFSNRRQYEAHEALHVESPCGGWLPFDQYGGTRGCRFRRVWWWQR